MDIVEWLRPKTRLIGTRFLGKLKCTCPEIEEDWSRSEQNIVGTNLASNEKLKTGWSADGLGFPQLLFMIKLLGAFATRQDLRNLKQLSQLYYKLINPIYLDLVESILSIGGRDQFRSLRFDIHEIWMTGTKKKASLMCGIPPARWDPELAHIFRKIIAPPQLSWLDQPDLQYDGIHLHSIISQIRPYITILQMPIFSLHPNFSDFINQFPKLKELRIGFPCSEAEDEAEMMDNSLNALKPILQNLRKTVKVKLKVKSNFWPILEAFGNTSGTTIEIHIPFNYPPGNVETFKSLSDNSEKWRNIKFIRLEFNISADSMCSELMSISYRYAKHQDQIQNCGMFINEFPPQHIPSEDSRIQQCMVKLSPTLSRLDLARVNHWNVLGLSSSTIWQKLRELRISGLEIRLDFLKGSSTSSSFPALISLKMYNIDQDVCIFHDSQKSHKEALVTYFGNLPKLTFLCLHCRHGTIDRLLISPELVSSLEELRPGLKVDTTGLPQINFKPTDHSY